MDAFTGIVSRVFATLTKEAHALARAYNRYDMHEDPASGYVYRVEVPGTPAEQVGVTADRTAILVTIPGVDLVRLPLHRDADPTGAAASLELGVLRIVVPRLPPPELPTGGLRIEVSPP